MDLKPLITLLAIVNPLAIVPFFIHYTQGFSAEQRRHTIWVSSFSCFVVIAVSALAGLHILGFFGISLPSFQVGGGMLLLTSALSMLNAQPAEAKTNAHEMEDGAEKVARGASIAVVPLTIPLLTGPASMSTVVIYAEKAKTFFPARHPGGLRCRNCTGHRAVLCIGRSHCPRIGQDRHQRDDAADGPDIGGAGGGGHVGWVGQTLPGTAWPNLVGVTLHTKHHPSWQAIARQH